MCSQILLAPLAGLCAFALKCGDYAECWRECGGVRSLRKKPGQDETGTRAVPSEQKPWMPACTGMTRRRGLRVDVNGGWYNTSISSEKTFVGRWPAGDATRLTIRAVLWTSDRKNLNRRWTQIKARFGPNTSSQTESLPLMLKQRSASICVHLRLKNSCGTARKHRC